MTNHLEDVKMTYTEHFKVSMNFARIFAKGFLTSVLHAVLPDWNTTCAKDTIEVASSEYNLRIHKNHSDTDEESGVNNNENESMDLVIPSKL